MKIKSTFEGMVDTIDLRVFYKPFEPVIERDERASSTDVAKMRDIYELAKDIRPLVTPIAAQIRSQEAFSAMIQDFFASRRAEPEATDAESSSSI